MAKRIAGIIFALTLILPGTAVAVWGGQVDTTHPSVGAMYFDGDVDGTVVVYDLICSGSYAGPSIDGNFDVFLTAGHCMPPPEWNLPPFLLKVSFDNNTDDIFPDDAITVSEYHQMPGFGQNRGDLRDLAVLLLPAGSVAAAFPDAAANAVELPPEGHMNQLKADKELKRRVVDIIGYGVAPVWNEPGRTSFLFDGIRRSGTSEINGLTKSKVLFNENPNGIGTGAGLCYGDSGSPQLDEGTLMVLSVTSGGNPQCRSISDNYRVDTPQAREFLGQFITLP